MSQAQGSKLSGMGKAFLVIALIIMVVAFVTGLVAIVNQRDTLLQVISFSLGFGSFISTIAAIPGLINHLRASLRALLYGAVVLIVLIALCLIPLVFLVSQEPVIKIGVSLPFGSADSPDAIPMFNAIQLAIHDGTESGKIGNYTIQLVPFDDSEMDHQKVSLVDQKGVLTGNVEDFSAISGDAQIAGIIGPFNSGTAVSELPLTNKASMALISPATTADCLTLLTNSNECQFSDLDKNSERSFFRLASADSFRAEVLAGYFWKVKIGQADTGTAKEAVIFDDESLFGRSFANRLQEAWKAKMNKRADIFDLSDNPQEDLKRLKTKPDVIIFSGTGPKAIALYNAMKATDYANTAFAAAATIMRGGLADASARGDIYAISPYGYFDQLKEYSKFRADYKNLYQKEPTPYSASAYDTTMILLKSIEEAVKHKNPPLARWDILLQADQFRAEVINNIKRVNNGNNGGIAYAGVTGTYHFDSSGDAINLNQSKDATIYKYDRAMDVWNVVSTSETQ